MSDYEKDLDDMVSKRRKLRAMRTFKRDARQLATTNHKGKVKKKRGKSNAENNHKKPRGWTRLNKSFTNVGNSLGMTDEEYKQYIKTGKIPARLKKKES